MCEPTKTLDAKELSCPMPVVKTHDAVDELESGEILQVVVTGSGSVSNLEGWADATDGVAMFDQGEAERDGDTVLRHFIQKE